ncbi:YqiA/YcfP family alpha/beta fold hydrolase [Halomonadaceae bacterium KBTZ08]
MATDDPDLIYLHGFRSAPASEKAGELDAWLYETGYQGRWLIPQLATTPEEVEAQLTDLIEATPGAGPGLIGSSLGGFFAMVMAERYGLAAVLINPAAYPYRQTETLLGDHTNLYTGERFHVTEQHLRQLEAMDPGTLSHPERLMVLLETGDETLDYREAGERFAQTRCLIHEGGNHRYTRFREQLPAMLDFLRQHQ